MKLSVGAHVFNTNQCVRHRDCIKVTVDRLSPRVYCKREEVLCHQRHNAEVFFNWVTVSKYIDDTLVLSYSWLQEVDEEDLQSFREIKESAPPPPPRKPELTPEEKELKHELKKKKNREYYYAHREEQLAKKKEYYRQNKQQQNDYSKQYYQEHKDTWNDKYVKPRKTK